jgi:hypothetical protein
MIKCIAFILYCGKNSEREEVILIGRKNQKVELTDLEKLRNRVKEIKKRKKGIYKRYTNQSNKRR